MSTNPTTSANVTVQSDEDVQGHVFRNVNETVESDDVEGHKLLGSNVNETVESDDVEGHKLAANVNETVESDDVEGVGRRTTLTDESDDDTEGQDITSNANEVESDDDV